MQMLLERGYLAGEIFIPTLHFSFSERNIHGKHDVATESTFKKFCGVLKFQSFTVNFRCGN